MLRIVASVIVACTTVAYPRTAPHPTPHPPTPRRHYLGTTRTTQYDLCCITASGIHVFYGEVAADPAIPFGARVKIPGLGTFTVLDRGSAVWGSHLDIWVPYVGYHAIKDWYSGVYWYLPNPVG